MKRFRIWAWAILLASSVVSVSLVNAAGAAILTLNDLATAGIDVTIKDNDLGDMNLNAG